MQRIREGLSQNSDQASQERSTAPPMIAITSPFGDDIALFVVPEPCPD